MEMTVAYIASQVLTVIMYILLGITYQIQDRKKVLIINVASLIVNAIIYILLNAYSGMSMCVVALIRNFIFLIDEKKNGKSDKISKKDVVILVLIYIACGICAAFTFDGFLSLFSIFATMVYTYSVWQKNIKVYKFAGILVSVCWIIYNLYVKSVFGVILEAALLICTIIGCIREVRREKVQQN